MKKPVGHQTTCDQSLNLDTAVGCLMGTALQIVHAVYACSVKALLEMPLVGPKPKAPTSPALILQTPGFGYIFNNYVEHNNQGGDISRILEPYFQSPMFLQSPGGSDGSICLQRGRPRFHPWVRKIPWRRKWQPTPILLPGKSYG